MRLLALPLLFLVALPAHADELTVLTEGLVGCPPREMLHRYLLQECQKHFDARRQAIAALKTPEDVKQRQQALREKFIESLGGFPAKTPLNPQVVGALQRDGYRIEKVIYESRPSHHVTANLYIPDGKGPFPGVLVPCGHSAEGKAAETYQRACILMAKNGLAVLCYDPIGQGERVQLLDKLGKPAIAGSTSEHTMCGIGALLVGRQTASYRIWDGIRGLDYLASRPEVDPARLGCTGNSGGGTLTAYLMALDDRILAAAPSCYITSLERLFATIGPQDAEQNITGQVAFGMEHADFITMRAPKPTLICTATRDFFDIQGSWTTFREVKKIYGLLGHGERVDLFEYDDQHGFSKPRREAACRWMLRWLAGRDEAVVEPSDLRISLDESLQCTRTGQVLEDLKGKSVFDLNAEREAELAEARERFSSKYGKRYALGDIPKLATELLGLGRTTLTASRITLGSADQNVIDRRKYVIEKQAWSTQDGVIIPLHLCKPNGLPAYVHRYIYLGENDIALAIGENGRIPPLVAAWNVLVPQLRGTGETAPAKARGEMSAPLGDTGGPFLALHLNKPLLGQRVQDLLAVMDAYNRKDNHPFRLIAEGSFGPVALHLAMLDKRVERVKLDRCLISWSSVVRTPISVNQLANVVPGALEYYDLPDLAATLAPRPLTILNPVDAAGNPVSQEELERVYAKAKEAYAKAGAADKLILNAGKK